MAWYIAPPILSLRAFFAL
uniref:Uncharacterized protein n=1 Tax=Arundo donax TaxID=35708 RepID=A0A0A9FYM0_ARUDO